MTVKRFAVVGPFRDGNGYATLRVMHSTIMFVVGQGAVIGGVLMLSKSLPWSACVAILLIAEGVVAAVAALVLNAGEDSGPPVKAWHE